jgi:hypothetical protein
VGHLGRCILKLIGQTLIVSGPPGCATSLLSMAADTIAVQYREHQSMSEHMRTSLAVVAPFSLLALVWCHSHIIALN